MPSKVTEDMTKAQLLFIIRGKLKRLKTDERAWVMRSLKYATKADLMHKATHMKVRVDKTGYDVMWRGY